MKITNEILLSFLNCPYKAHMKLSSDKGNLSDFEQLSAEFTKAQKGLFAEKLSTEKRLIRSLLTDTDFKIKNGVIVNQKFSNTNFELVLDGIELIDKNRIIPILITPFEKITQTEKLFIALLSSYIQSEFNLNIESCKIIHGKNFNETNLKFSSFTKNIKKIIRELNKMVYNSVEPSLILNKHCSVCEFRAICKEKAMEDGNLSLLDRATSKTIEKYKKKGIFTIQQLSYIYKPRRRKKQAKELITHNLELQALAIRTDKIYVQQLPELPKQSTRLFLDIEGIPDQKSYYLIGVLVCKDETTICNSFWADKTVDEAQIWQQFLSFLNDYPDAPLYHYGNYESKAIDILGKRYNTNVVYLQNRLINIVNSIFGKIYFPVYSNRLKEIGNYLGATWSSSDASGIQSLVWRYLWEESQNEKHKKLLIEYNLGDCIALKLLVDNLTEIEKRNDAVTNFQDEIRSDRCPRKSEDKIHQQLTEILSFSYTTEHYNRSKIFFNNDKQEKKPEEIDIKKRRNRKPYKLKPTKSIKILRRMKCPICGFMPLKESNKTTEKTTVDLKFTQNTIIKEVRRYWANRSYCQQCKKDFTPPYFNVHGHPGIYGRNIKIWVCYLRIVLRNPYSLIRKITSDLFKFNLSDAVIIRFIEEVGSYYLQTEKILISNLLKGKFIHIDETTINIDGQNQYVWVLRNDTAVYLKHTETRENEFIKNLLMDYSGIIITDFYSGYDSINCLKQRCWVHLIREINNELWKAPLDREFQLFVESLRDLLLPIMKTIQKYGLKKRNLNKHKKEVEVYYKTWIFNKDYNSLLCLNYQKRLQKNKDELFTFLNHDDILWHNNPAEIIVKHLKLQGDISKSYSSAVTIHYLRLLSIMQTCRFQNKSFLHFLLSGKQDVNDFHNADKTLINKRPYNCKFDINLIE